MVNSNFHIELDKDFYVTADRTQYILVKKLPNSEQNVGYFVTLDHLFNEYIQVVLRASNISSMEMLITSYKEASKRLSKVLEPLKLEMIKQK